MKQIKKNKEEKNDNKKDSLVLQLHILFLIASRKSGVVNQYVFLKYNLNITCYIKLRKKIFSF